MIKETMAQIVRERMVERLFAKDTTLWKNDEASRKQIENSLGWVDVAEQMLPRCDEFTAFAKEIQDAGFKDIVLLGMGGSSLCAEVFRTVFHVNNFHVLDSTVPAAVKSVQDKVDLKRTLFIVASKSGSTVEPQMFMKYFYGLVKNATSNAGDQFIAITDPGSLLQQQAKDLKFRRTFLGLPTIGGRYSALSPFGMVPAALMGIDIRTLLERVVASDHSVALERAALMASMATNGRDKMIVSLPARLESLGLWIEQLVAESTGKEGKGILPINDGLSTSDDRFAIKVECDPLSLGAEMFTWEVATALTGALLGVNPFDQPNVQESKEITVRLIAEHKKGRQLSQPAPDEPLTAFLKKVHPRDYFAILGYFHETPERNTLIDALRKKIEERVHVATTFGYGPRYLHSTGQLHKGGGDQGLFLYLTADDEDELPIPEEGISFSVLKTAQAVGDEQALSERGRRVHRIHLGKNIDEALKKVIAAL